MDLIEFLFNQTEEGVEVVDNVNDPYPPNQVLYMAYILVFDTGQLNFASKKWTNKIPAKKTWVNFKTYVVQDYTMIQESHATSDISEFGSANAIMEETVTPFANLAANTAADRNITQAFTTTKTRLLTELAPKKRLWRSWLWTLQHFVHS